MNKAHLLPIKEALDVSLVGGKAINLAKLMRAGLPVPDGFVVTTTAFREAENAEVSVDLADEIREALMVFQGKRMAARSSATAEDMAGASMAGQYDTFLNLETEKEIMEAIEKCWKSVKSDRTKAYLSGHGIAIDEVAMAVVVQQQVAADVAGVLFTVDPRTGCRDTMLIEASWGLGETIVSGDVQPDVIHVSATGKQVKDYTVSEKKNWMRPSGNGVEPVPGEMRNRACLKYEQIMRLQELGQLAVTHFGAPQDIEWAIEDDEVLMLQARPITTLEETEVYNRLVEETKNYLSQRLENGGGPWVRHNLGETLPHPTPLTWKLVSRFMSGSGGFGKMHEELGFAPGPAVKGRSFLDRLGGEIYMDCALMTEMFSEGYPFAYDPEQLRTDPDAAQNPPSVPSGNLKEIGKAAQLATSAAATIEKLTVDLDQKFDEKYVPELLQWSIAQESISLVSLGHAALIELWKTQAEKVLDDFGVMAFLPSMVEAVAVEELRRVIDEQIWDEEPDALVSALSVSAVPDQTLSANMALKNLELDDWLSKYGHRATAEFDLASPRWNERPDDVRVMAEQLEGSDLQAMHHERMQQADEVLEMLKAKLDAPSFEKLKTASDVVRRYMRFREDGKFYLMRAYSVLRRTALEFGARLGVDGDIFFLEPEEMFQALETGFVPKDRIDARKLEYQVENRLQTPHVIEAYDVPNLGKALVRADGPALEAHSVSCGSATGAVAIVLSPEQGHDLETGAILVCPSTDPSWTPLFAKVGGLVLERGGSLSHGAVVAREMGLPAVVLDGATELLEQGESITVDANAGWIYREGADTEVEDSHIPRAEVPPPASQKEASANRLGLVMALVWGVVLGGVFLLPPNILHDPFMRLLDALLWPLVRSFGMIGAVAAVAALLGLLPILVQRFITDNVRLFEAKRRAGLLRKGAAQLPKGSGRRKKMEALAAPVTTRILKASMVPLAMILGPMIMVFVWFPLRVDPASWNAKPGRMVNVVAEVDGDCREAVSLHVPAPLRADVTEQVLPPIRQELEELRAEWRAASDMSDLPWEVQSAGDQTRLTMLSSLNAFLKEGVPPQKLAWLVSVPENAGGAHPIQLNVGEKTVAEMKLVFGRDVPPAPSALAKVSDDILSITVNYPRPLQKKASFFELPGTKKDLGWLGVYLFAYLPTMFAAKFVLRVP